MAETRACERCGAALSRYNPDAKCAACQRIAPEAQPAIPARVWQVREVRQALQGWDFRTLLTLVRKLSGLRQQDLAALTGLNQGFLSQVERGTNRLHNIDKIIDVFDGLDVPLDALPTPRRIKPSTSPSTLSPTRPGRPPEHDHVPDHTWEYAQLVKSLTVAVGESEGVERRHFLAAGTAVAAYAYQWMTQPTPALGTTGSGTAINRGTVDLLQTTTDQLRHLDAEMGSGDLTAVGRAHLSLITNQLRNARYDEATGRQLARVAADTAMLTGWFHIDANQNEQAQQLLFAALRAAHAAEDPALGAGALSFLAIQGYSIGDPRDAVTLMHTARANIKGMKSPHLHAMLLTRQARGDAKLGEKSACQRALGEAEELASAPRGVDDPAYLYWIHRGEVLGQAGSCHLELGDTRRASEAFGQACDALSAKDRRTRAIFTSRAGLAHLTAGDFDLASAQTEAALDLADQVQSPRLTDQLATISSAFAPHRRNRTTRDTYERLQTMLAGAGAQT